MPQDTKKEIRKKVGISHQQRAYEFVKDQIMSLELKPAQYINDSEVAQAIDISRTPAREALRRLEQEGLLVSEHRRGWKVYALTLEDIEEIFEIKIELEGMLVRKAANCDDEQMRSSLKETFGEMKAAAQNNDFTAWQDADLKLHNIIFGMCSNNKARNIIKNLNDQWYRLRPGISTLEGRLARSVAEHEAIVNSILSGDEDQAEIEMQTHLENVREELTRVMSFILNFSPEGV